METLVQDKEEILKKNTVIKKISVHITLKMMMAMYGISMLHNFIWIQE